jgi:hypothetical protein
MTPLPAHQPLRAMREEQFPHARILIIDDERFHIDFLTTLLRNAGTPPSKG